MDSQPLRFAIRERRPEPTFQASADAAENHLVAADAIYHYSYAIGTRRYWGVLFATGDTLRKGRPGEGEHLLRVVAATDGDR